MKYDGHIHTPFCPHGSDDAFEAYIEEAIEQGFTTISFTEHAPLPESFTDPTPDKDSGMPLEQLMAYIEAIAKLKEKYKSQLCIKTGLEIDYIEGYEKETTAFLNEYGPYLDDSILSVHFLKNNDHYYCLDFSDEHFSDIITQFGSLQQTYATYYETVKRSVEADLGAYKPKRIGHITLIRKFQKRFPCHASFQHKINDILSAIKKAELQLDYNAAGLSKPLCNQTYPSERIIKQANKMNIPFVYGSDAHTAAALGQHYSTLEEQLKAK